MITCEDVFLKYTHYLFDGMSNNENLFQMSLSLYLDMRKFQFMRRREGVVTCATFVMRVLARVGERRKEKREEEEWKEQKK